MIAEIFLTDMTRLLIAGVMLILGTGLLVLVQIALRLARAALRWGWRVVGRVPA